MGQSARDAWVRIEPRQCGLPTLHVGGVAFHFTGHVLKRCEEMDLTMDTVVDVLTQGRRQRNTPRSVHYRDGRGWLARWRDLSVGLVENGPSDFTVTTVLWRDENRWDEWFKHRPSTTRTHRPPHDKGNHVYQGYERAGQGAVSLDH